MAKVFGGGGGSTSYGDSGASRVLPTSQRVPRTGSTQSFTSSPNVYPGTQSSPGGANSQNQYTRPEVQAFAGSSADTSCGDSGISRVLPTSAEALRSDHTQTFESTPNVYSKTQSATGSADLKDFYTKTEVQKLLKNKADISSVYTEAEVDSALDTLEGQIRASLTAFITGPEVDSKISASYNSLLSYLSQNYYNKTQTYSKGEVNSLIAAIDAGTGFVMKQPATTADNTISPGANEAIPLTLVASTDPDITTIQHWVDSQSNSVGRVRTSGRVEFYGHLVLGQNVEAWSPALDTNQRRISGVADPVHVLDAVNKKYLEDYVVEVVDGIQQGKTDIYDIDCLTY